jgi:hypothetical protein
MWEHCVDYVWQTHNLYPLKRNATASGRGPRPLTQISDNHIDEDECERRIEHSMQPGTLSTAVVYSCTCVGPVALVESWYEYASMDQIGGPAAGSWSALNGQKMAMRQRCSGHLKRDGPAGGHGY